MYNVCTIMYTRERERKGDRARERETEKVRDREREIITLKLSL